MILLMMSCTISALSNFYLWKLSVFLCSSIFCVAYILFWFFFSFPFYMFYILLIIQELDVGWIFLRRVPGTWSSRSLSWIIAVYRIKIITQLLLIALVMYGYLIKFVSKWNGKKLFTKIKLSCFWNGNKLVTTFSTFFSWNEDKHSDFRFQ